MLSTLDHRHDDESPTASIFAAGSPGGEDYGGKSVEHSPEMSATSTATYQTNRRATWIAWRIEEDIHADGWPFGTAYGSQSELRKRYGAGTESLREAISLLEFNGVARMRRGHGGGLVVERPSLSLVIASVVGYFRVVRANSGSIALLDQVNSARASLAAVAARMVSERTAGSGGREFLTRLQQLLAVDTTDLPVVLATVLDDPCLQLCACCLNSLGHAAERGEHREESDSRLSRDTAARDVLDAIAAGESAVAAQRASRLTLMNPTRWLAEPSLIDDPFVAQDSPLNRSRVGQLVRRIATDLSRSNIAEQGHLGSEAVLSERYTAARSTLRQALRVLEDARIIATRRGRGHGWFACATNRDLCVRQIRNYLAGSHVLPSHAGKFTERWRLATHEIEMNSVLNLLLQGIQAYADRQSIPMRQS
jgi:DNA-binding FadR family transcriptional regulator